MADKYDIVNPNRQFNDWGSIEQQIIKLDKKIDAAITGSVDYNLTRNKPQINGNTLSGDKTSESLGIVQDLHLSIDEQNNLTVTLRSGERDINSDTIAIPTASAIKNVYIDYATNTIVIEFTNDQVLSIPLEDFISLMMPIHCQLVISTNWSQITGTNKYEQDLTWQINYILGQIPLYNRYYPLATDNPSQLGLYEQNALGQYVLTEDTTVVNDKAYYERVYKTLTENNLMEITATPEMQSIINNSDCSRITLETSIISDTPVLKAIAEDGYPDNQFSINVTINTIVNMTQATLVSNPLYNNYILQDEIDDLETNKQDKIEDHIQALTPTDNDYLSDLDDTTNKRWTFGNIWLWIKGKITQVFYPIGTVVFNTGTNPQLAWGGTWELLANETSALYIDSTAGLTINEELPNIKGQINDINFRGSSGQSITRDGVFTDCVKVNGNNIGCGTPRGDVISVFKFDASKSSSVYKDDGHVRPAGITVCAWERTA